MTDQELKKPLEDRQLALDRDRLELERDKHKLEYQKNVAKTTLDQDKQDLKRKKMHMDQAIALTDRTLAAPNSDKAKLWETYDFFYGKLIKKPTVK